jgi:peptidyl-prolyl cis-trans isomerase SDCCAG10
MSNIYHTEPATYGKVLLHTNFGDIDVELWSKEAPLACRNFVQHCLNGYYENNIFHRVIKGFMAQSGDPTGTGQGGESIWGRPFKDEPHGRIKFNHRGQLACANEQKPDSNHSQFFMTFAGCEWLDRKHTIFGKVTGNTIFNLLRMNDVEVDSADRPIDDIRIDSVEVLMNPFDDVVKQLRNSNSTLTNDNDKNSQRKGTKDLKLLSFEDGEDEGEGGGMGMWKSKKAKNSQIKSDKDKDKNKNKNVNVQEDMNMNMNMNMNMTSMKSSAQTIREVKNAREQAGQEDETGKTSEGGHGSDGDKSDSHSRKNMLAQMKQQLAEARETLSHMQPGNNSKSESNPNEGGDIKKTEATKGLSLLEQQRSKYIGKRKRDASGVKEVDKGKEKKKNETEEKPEGRSDKEKTKKTKGFKFKVV